MVDFRAMLDQETQETIEAFIHRMNKDPDSVRREWEAEWLRQRGQEWVDENKQYFDAWWLVILAMHGYEV